MSVKEQILNDIKSAMKAGNSFERDTLRMISSVFKQIEVDERVQLDDDRVFVILQSEIKRRNESATQYKNGGRDDLAQKELDEISIISRYLPKQLSDDELKSKMEQLVSQNGLSGIKDLGALMKLAKEAIGSACDGKRMSDAAKKALS
ncbi:MULTISPECIES: GatB/YqeY domain-containing protein [Campylobacter]|uniref:GatB/YqeY family protein n=1 Tax=Campylobacter porcelli TaxID=1660073 RepID=A0A1X9SYQ6_9BACT|nr:MULTISPECIES: GatB/YqeY domain-containing protein [unclassified Campylobacter]ARR01259.1 GatB/YqeY family protein [Campylobacter sp. RM6137]MCR8679093.1 GatB/YqeY domain-containing protein [Campylobacter sp. RM19072]MCR8696082.1 GatB/YqeY domain-containing protein [Campylobacter sp. RM19073]MEE3704663.1 GatB/YqeY domain-containing protein [Campylobacter sp. CX2-8023-23]